MNAEKSIPTFMLLYGLPHGQSSTLEAVAEKSNALFALFSLRPGKRHHFLSDRLSKGMLR
jgi:hypothetical protein